MFYGQYIMMMIFLIVKYFIISAVFYDLLLLSLKIFMIGYKLDRFPNSDYDYDC